MSSDSESEVANELSESDQDSDISDTDLDEKLSKLKSKTKKNGNSNAQLQTCTKLMLPDHLAAYLEERELGRDVEPIQCTSDIIENIFGNYLIVKNILSHLRWQEKLICKDVCRLWKSAVNRLQLEQIGPCDFSINSAFRAVRDGFVLLKSSEFYTEPMAVFTFGSSVAYHMSSISCQAILPSPCAPPCDEKHSILDIIHQHTTAPRNCMYTVKASSISYMPLPHSPTMKNFIQKPLKRAVAGFCGLYIPQIPNVEFRIINVNCSTRDRLKPEIKELTEDYTVRGVVACLTENYLLYEGENSAECLDFLNAMQPDVPFAFGGCLIEDTATEEQDLVGIVESVNNAKQFVSGNIMSLGIFVTPKDGGSTVNEPKNNFEVYSFIVESKEWSKMKIARAIKEFSESVPRFEHSAALQFSCIGRQHKNATEQHYFRLHFPSTRLVGCFGNGELGVNHPERPPPPQDEHQAKRAKEYQDYEKVHSYSTVFFFLGWGKIIEEADHDD